MIRFLILLPLLLLLGCRTARTVSESTTETHVRTAAVAAPVPDSVADSLIYRAEGATLIYRRDTITKRIVAECRTEPVRVEVRERRTDTAPAPPPPPWYSNPGWLALSVLLLALVLLILFK